MQRNSVARANNPSKPFDMVLTGPEQPNVGTAERFGDPIVIDSLQRGRDPKNLPHITGALKEHHSKPNERVLSVASVPVLQAIHRNHAPKGQPMKYLGKPNQMFKLGDKGFENAADNEKPGHYFMNGDAKAPSKIAKHEHLSQYAKEKGVPLKQAIAEFKDSGWKIA